jgi:hypothetical protein
MLSGMNTFTIVHVLISLAGILTGIVVMLGLLANRRLDGWTAIFILTTVATSVTGFFFPFHRLLPSHIIGILSLITLAFAIIARYGFYLAGAWRKTYVISAMLSLYFNVFVLVVQLYRKVPALNALAPTQTEAPFKLTQLAVLVVFVILTILAAIRFRGGPYHTA